MPKFVLKEETVGHSTRIDVWLEPIFKPGSVETDPPAWDFPILTIVHEPALGILIRQHVTAQIPYTPDFANELGMALIFAAGLAQTRFGEKESTSERT